MSKTMDLFCWFVAGIVTFQTMIITLSVLTYGIITDAACVFGFTFSCIVGFLLATVRLMEMESGL